ncbi:MAG: hypothetical protein LC645_03200 [Geobacteraceae bacterium]|nr:hypothetical protein [Geobacteraceae bacterium]
MSKASNKHKILEAYLGYATLLVIGRKHNVSEAYVGQVARELCLEYARILPGNHPLKTILDSGQSVRRSEWREYKQDILDYFENKKLQNNPKGDLSPQHNVLVSAGPQSAKASEHYFRIS